MTPMRSRRNRARKTRGDQKLLRRVFVIALIPVSVAGVIFLFLSLYLFLRGAPFLRLKEATIRGNKRISTEEILGMTGLKEKPNILTLDIKALNTRLGQQPWIEKSTIQRVFPNGIRITVQERSPVAIVHLGKLYFIDKNRVIFDEVDPEEASAYPIFTGAVSEDIETNDRNTCRLLQGALHLLKVARGHPIITYESISRIHLDKAVGLLVYTKAQGTEFRLGFSNFERKLQRLSKIWPLIRSLRISAVDCTVPGRIIVQKKE
jgi:cell division protein FtsQ